MTIIYQLDCMIIMVCIFKDPKKEIKMVRTQILKGVKCKFKWKGILIKSRIQKYKQSILKSDLKALYLLISLDYSKLLIFD